MPLLVYVFGLDAKTAIASSLLIVGIASLSGVAHHWRAGNVDVRTGLIFGAAGMTGALVGAQVGAYLDGTLLLLLFATMMVLTGIFAGRATRGAPRDPSVERLFSDGGGI